MRRGLAGKLPTKIFTMDWVYLYKETLVLLITAVYHAQPITHNHTYCNHEQSKNTKYPWLTVQVTEHKH